MKRRKSPCLLDEEIEEIPLGHERNEAAMRWEMGEIGHNKSLGSHLAREFAYFLMRTLEKFIQDAQLEHQLECRRMNRVATKIAEEIGVFFEHEHIHARSRQQEAQHHSGGPASGDAASRLHSFSHSIC